MASCAFLSFAAETTASDHPRRPLYWCIQQRRYPRRGRLLQVSAALPSIETRLPLFSQYVPRNEELLRGLRYYSSVNVHPLLRHQLLSIHVLSSPLPLASWWSSLSTERSAQQQMRFYCQARHLWISEPQNRCQLQKRREWPLHWGPSRATWILAPSRAKTQLRGDSKKKKNKATLKKNCSNYFYRYYKKNKNKTV